MDSISCPKKNHMQDLSIPISIKIILMTNFYALKPAFRITCHDKMRTAEGQQLKRYASLSGDLNCNDIDLRGSIQMAGHNCIHHGSLIVQNMPTGWAILPG